MKHIRLHTLSAEQVRLTLEQARADLVAKLQDPADRDGAICPCCGQTARVYRRSIYGPMVKVLLTLYRASPNAVKLSDKTSGGDYAKLQLWGLIEGSNRHWKITAKGAAFVEEGIRVPRYVYVYAGQFVGIPHDVEMVKVSDLIGESFDIGVTLDASELPADQPAA